MIYCSDKNYAKVWKITPSEKYLDLQISTSEKDKRDGHYINSSWFPRCIGHAFNTLKDNLHEGDRIIITKSKFTNEKYTTPDGQTKSSFRFLILEAEVVGNDQQQAAPPSPKTEEAPTAVDESCPW